jgi:hypothetical protein
LDWIKDGNKVHIGKLMPRGSRLTPERLTAMEIGDGTLSREEKELITERILFQFEDVITFEDSYMGLLDPAIEPPIVIQTIPHQP